MRGLALLGRSGVRQPPSLTFVPYCRIPTYANRKHSITSMWITSGSPDGLASNGTEILPMLGRWSNARCCPWSRLNRRRENRVSGESGCAWPAGR